MDFVSLQKKTRAMQFVRVLRGYEHLWAVKSPDKEYDELTDLFRCWNDAEYLLEFFVRNFNDLKSYFHIERIAEAIDDTFQDADELEGLILNFPYTEHLDTMFRPLDATDAGPWDYPVTKRVTGIVNAMQVGLGYMRFG